MCCLCLFKPSYSLEYTIGVLFVCFKPRYSLEHRIGVFVVFKTKLQFGAQDWCVVCCVLNQATVWSTRLVCYFLCLKPSYSLEHKICALSVCLEPRYSLEHNIGVLFVAFKTSIQFEAQDRCVVD